MEDKKQIELKAEDFDLPEYENWAEHEKENFWWYILSSDNTMTSSVSTTTGNIYYLPYGEKL